jgi:hypothetical protein
MSEMGDQMASLPVPDDLLAEIFLRLSTPDDLVRASAACVSFRRLVSDRSFLRKYRKLQAPPFLGLLKDRAFHPAVTPHPSAPAASALALAADFSFSFLPAPACDWVVQDSRDGRVLLDRPCRHRASHDCTVTFTETEMVVCDPLHRRYLLLPPIPSHLAATVEEPFPGIWEHLPETFLVPTTDDKEPADAQETSFRVIYMAQCKLKLLIFLFSSSTGQWQAAPSQGWSDLFASLLTPTRSKALCSRQYAYGCFYWMIYPKEQKMLALDVRRMEFSIAELPRESKRDSYILDSTAITMVEAGGGRPGMFVLAHDRTHLIYAIRRYSGSSSSQWQREKTIPLGSRCWLRGSAGRYLLLFKSGSSSLNPCYITLDIKTFQLEKVCSLGIPAMHAYNNFPPSMLSSPTI